MFIERKINPTTRIVELWKTEWENIPGEKSQKRFIEKIRDEQTALQVGQTDLSNVPAICWSNRRTLGNIAVYSQSVLGRFPGKAGTDAILPCDIVDAGKYRHGASRWWCRTHQVYWGSKADNEAYHQTGNMNCASNNLPMNYVVGPTELNTKNFPFGGIWCSMPPAYSTKPITPRAPKIHVHVREDEKGTKLIDQDFDAVSIRHEQNFDFFNDLGIHLVNITPPAAFEFVRNLELGVEMVCIKCKKCGYPHLDMGDFSSKAHKKHFCANCGFDSTWSKTPVISTPLKLLHDAFPHSNEYIFPNNSLNLDKYPGCSYDIWPSTPAIIWKADRPQHKGIHVHLMDGLKWIENETFSEVILNGEKISRSTAFELMISRTII